jgi:hypothetical protein
MFARALTSNSCVTAGFDVVGFPLVFALARAVSKGTPGLLGSSRRHSARIRGSQSGTGALSSRSRDALLKTGTGAPGSPQRTWAENGSFKCFHSEGSATPTKGRGFGANLGHTRPVSGGVSHSGITDRVTHVFLAFQIEAAEGGGGVLAATQGVFPRYRQGAIAPIYERNEGKSLILPSFSGTSLIKASP